MELLRLTGLPVDVYALSTIITSLHWDLVPLSPHFFDESIKWYYICTYQINSLMTRFCLWSYSRNCDQSSVQTAPTRVKISTLSSLLRWWRLCEFLTGEVACIYENFTADGKYMKKSDEVTEKFNKSDTTIERFKVSCWCLYAFAP